MKTLLFVELPPPTHGMTYINQIIYDNFKKNDCYDIVETNYTNSLSEIGILSLSKLIRNIIIACSCWGALNRVRPNTVYYALSASKFGIIRDFIILLPLMFLKTKRVFHLHGFTHFKSYNESMLYKIVFKLITKNSLFIVLGSAQKEIADNLFNTQSIIIENCINSTPKKTLRKIDSEKPIKLLYISNISKSKGTFDLLNAVKEMRNISLTIAGGILEDNDEFLQLINRVKNANFIGFADENKKHELFNSHHIFCLPSKLEEGSPISIIEAMSQSIPILASSKGCIPEMINGCGYLLNKYDRISDIQIGIKYILENYDELSDNSYTRFIENYSKESFLKKLEKVLCSFL